ncbi:transaldolase [Lacticaseibacillus zeae]|uniref:Transaldolase n=1 Tax=Lacticaseibacillus zeae TaxID=57037 RepID=A0A5R8LNQ7_LACZE|nr:transaldolase [Lacticaseibacillus zeae]TLF38867.1 transaldolase [Lacticaseibacillus zeae]
MKDFNVAIYADGASVEGMVEAKSKWPISGFTTNPTLMKRAGISDYMSFAKDALKAVEGLPISFEVFADDFPTMKKEAEKLAALSKNVFVKIPITNTKGESSAPLIKKLSAEGIQVNATAILTYEQVKEVADALSPNTHNIISVFAGRLADTGVDPIPLMRKSQDLVNQYPQASLLWASSRELLNIFQADNLGIDIITVTNAILEKMKMIGLDPKKLSLDTVQGFHKDVNALGFSIL